MKLSKFFIPTKKESPSEAKIKSHILMIRSGMIKMESSGIYTWLPLGFKVLEKIKKIIEKEHELYDVNQFLMPTIQSSEIWKKSGRDDSYGKEMLRVLDRHNKDLLYGPTNEEMVTSIGSDLIKTFKALPLYLYHIQTKFRDEIRPRFGVMRAREFIMKDAYSFDIDKNKALITYEMFFNLYISIFKKIGLNIVPVRALSGEIGGDVSHEFHIVCDSGESNIYYDEQVKKVNFKEKNYNFYKHNYSSTDDFFDKLDEAPKNLIKKKSIEIGHIFLFGTKYSESFNFNINSNSGAITPYMGSYGIGLSRIPAAVIELNNDEKGIIWPKEIAPFSVIILNLKPDDRACSEFCEKLYLLLREKKIDILLDDRSERVGIKFSEADLIGIPLQVIIGNEYKENKIITIKLRKNNEELLTNETKILDDILLKIKND